MLRTCANLLRTIGNSKFNTPTLPKEKNKPLGCTLAHLIDCQEFVFVSMFGQGHELGDIVTRYPLPTLL